MSIIRRYLGPLTALTLSLSVTCVAVSYNSYSAARDREEMRRGVVRDKERLKGMGVERRGTNPKTKQ